MQTQSKWLVNPIKSDWHDKAQYRSDERTRAIFWALLTVTVIAAAWLN